MTIGKGDGGGPGWFRLRRNVEMEVLRQKVLEEQRRAMNDVLHPPTKRKPKPRPDGYPEPQRRDK